MTKVSIVPIDNLLKQTRLKDRKDIAILFVTLRPDYYDFGTTKFLHLTVKDSHGEDINYEMFLELADFFDYSKHSDFDKEEFTIYICCDAGISRSPAFAKFACRYLELDDRGKEIEETYRFLNEKIYKRLVNLFIESIDGA